MARLLVFFRALGHSTSSFGDPKAPGVRLPLLRGHGEEEEGGSESSALFVVLTLYYRMSVIM